MSARMIEKNDEEINELRELNENKDAQIAELQVEKKSLK